MFQFNWDTKKHEWLKENRGIGFEEIVFLITNGNLLDVIDNKSRNFPDQKIFVVEVNNYIYLVPFVKNENEYFLKTIIPSRKATKKYLK